VSAGGELKASLGTSELADALAKGGRFKHLRYRAHAGAVVYGRHDADLARFYEAPPFIVIAIESSISIQTMLDRLDGAPQVPSPDDKGTPQDPIDAVFLLDRGVGLNLGDGHGQIQFRQPDAKPLPGWVFYETGTVIAEMLIWLYRVMPRYSMASGSPINNYGTRSAHVSFHRPTPHDMSPEAAAPDRWD
jgi:hypothetical protein